MRIKVRITHKELSEAIDPDNYRVVMLLNAGLPMWDNAHKWQEIAHGTICRIKTSTAEEFTWTYYP